ncbi:MAG: hypothetical protein ABF322_00290 [Lentimonas sp.]
MDFIKKNRAFVLLVIICVLASVAGAYLAFAESGKVKSAQKKINSAEAQLSNLLVASPAPSAANVTASKQNVVGLEAQLKKIRENLQKGSRINASTDGIGVMAAIQQYITEYQGHVAGVTNEAGEVTPIQTPDNFAFGFEKYIQTGELSKDDNANAALDKQRQILSYIVNKLIDSKPAGISSVQRELLEETNAAANKPTAATGFVINNAITARVPGAIDTMAFSVTFSGYTDSLRAFLNSLAKFDLPIVVRSIEVERPQGSATTAAAPGRNDLDDIFGAFGGASAAAVSEPESVQKPVISENVSSFTVVLEFIEIILPSNSEKNPS